MTKRGRPPREDGRRTIATRIAATPTEEKLINTSYTTDEKRRAIMAWADVKALIDYYREFILCGARDGQTYCRDCDVYTKHGHDEDCGSAKVLAPFDDAIPVHETV